MAKRKPPSADAEILESEKWGVPDWRNKNKYPLNDADLSLNSWRWEFLRRDKSYRDAWDHRKQHRYRYTDYALDDWLDPREQANPNFKRSCYKIKFDKKDPWEQQFHYMALNDRQNMSGLIFSIDMYEPIKPQLAIIEAAHKTAQRRIDPDDRPKKAPRKNNSTSKLKSRSRGFLLRILDAKNAKVPVADILDRIAEEGIDITEAALRRTIDFATDFWQRL